MFPSGRHPSVLFLVFPLVLCYEIWNHFIVHSHNMTPPQSQICNSPQNYYFIIFIATFSTYITSIIEPIYVCFLEIHFNIILELVYLTLRTLFYYLNTFSTI